MGAPSIKKCDGCGAEWLLRGITYPSRNVAHDLECPDCGTVLMRVPSGTWDYEPIRIRTRDT